MAKFNLKTQNYYDLIKILGLRIWMWPYWISYQNKRFFQSYFPAFLSSNRKKNIFLITIELIKLTVIWRCFPYHYFRYGLYDKDYNFSQILSFLPETVFYYKIMPKINKRPYLLDNKNIFEDMIKGQNISFPRTIFKISNKTIFNNSGDVILDDFSLKTILKSTKSKIIFCKPADCGSGGSGILVFKKLFYKFIDNKERIINYKYLQKLSRSEWIIQEGVENTEDLKKIHPFSTNSFRVMTFYKPGIGAKAIYCILKLGNNKAYTDNAHTGGIYVRIDVETGNLDDKAYDENLKEYLSHPYSGYIFSGKRIKEIKKVINMAEKLGNIFNSLTFIGWDIALTPNGPVVLEGNSSPGLTIIQRTSRGMAEFIKLTK